jgi:hypothetical protein
VDGGGGVKGGSLRRDRRDGCKAAEKPVSVHDVHATILHLLGWTGKRLTTLHNGCRHG